MDSQALPYLKENIKQCTNSGRETPEFATGGMRDGLQGGRDAVKFYIWLLLQVES